MNIVIQCASSKSASAGYMKTDDGRNVVFVANPAQTPPKKGVLYVRPDDIAQDGLSWRDMLQEYNRRPDNNPLRLLPSWRLYSRDVYGQLVKAYGEDKVFILSAGWGLIRADFLTPYYDITFSSARNVDHYKRRSKKDIYQDFNQLPTQDKDDLVFFGGKDYLPLFCELTRGYPGKRYVFYNSSVEPTIQGCIPVKYETSARTNWHYLCASDFINHRIALVNNN
jgi:hypothetical protein